MKAKTRNRLPVDALMKFTPKKYFYEWYWDYGWKDFKGDPVIVVNYNYADSERPDILHITLTYLDLNKDFHPSSGLEQIVSHTFQVPTERVSKGMTGKKEKDFIFKLKVENKLLWKIKFEVESKKPKSILYYAITDSILIKK
jgi:hypothetical protein